MSLMSSTNRFSTWQSRAALGTYRTARFFLSQDALVRSATFRALYFAYKRRFADPFARLPVFLPGVYSGGSIIDIGANIGYTTSVFHQFMDTTSHLFAFEPERQNFEALSRLSKSWENVECIQTAVGSDCGDMLLRSNPFHPGDHRVVAKSASNCSQETLDLTPCSCTTLDSFLASRSISPKDITFLKIDVQGFEPAVIAGAHRLLSEGTNLRMALEFDWPAICAMGFSPRSLLRDIQELGFTIHRLHTSGRFEPLGAVTEVTACDILCLRGAETPTSDSTCNPISTVVP